MTHIERLCRASDKEAAMQVITAIRATLCSHAWRLCA